MQKITEGVAVPILRPRSARRQKSRTARPTLRILALAGALALSVGLWIGGYALVRLIF